VDTWLTRTLLNSAVPHLIQTGDQIKRNSASFHYTRCVCVCVCPTGSMQKAGGDGIWISISSAPETGLSLNLLYSPVILIRGTYGISTPPDPPTHTPFLRQYIWRHFCCGHKWGGMVLLASSEWGQGCYQTSSNSKDRPPQQRINCPKYWLCHCWETLL